MAKQKYTLNPEEKIVYKASHVRHGFQGAYTHVLTITNQSVILEKYGVLRESRDLIILLLTKLFKANHPMGRNSWNYT